MLLVTEGVSASHFKVSCQSIFELCPLRCDPNIQNSVQILAHHLSFQNQMLSQGHFEFKRSIN